MTLHHSSGRRGLGFGLAFTTMALWGMLPIALKGVLPQMDAATITFYRFAVSSILLLGILGARGQLPPLSRLSGRSWLLLGTTTLFLAINYQGYLVALDWTTPADAQVVIQLAPLLLAVGGLAIFRERFSRAQWLGVAVLLCGLALFWSGQLGAAPAGGTRYLRGNAVMLLAAVTWAIYGLSQKQLLRSLGSQQIMVCVYAGCALLFLPLARPVAAAQLDAGGRFLLGFCALNTLVAYGAFSESLAHWEASRVSAVLALTPMATLAFAAAASSLWPRLDSQPPLPAASWAGACLVVAGSVATALGERRWRGRASRGAVSSPPRR